MNGMGIAILTLPYLLKKIREMRFKFGPYFKDF